MKLDLVVAECDRTHSSSRPEENFHKPNSGLCELICTGLELEKCEIESRADATGWITVGIKSVPLLGGDMFSLCRRVCDRPGRLTIRTLIAEEACMMRPCLTSSRLGWN